MKNLSLAGFSILSFAFAASLSAQSSTTTTQVIPENPVKLAVGFDYSRGDYGFSSDTTVYSVPANLSVESTDWLARVTVPYVTVKGPASVVGDVGPAFASATRPTSKSESGLGDTVLSLTYHAHHAADGLTIDLTGRVKFGTASESRGLGTGETDYYVQSDFFQTFGSVTPFATIGYRFLGTNATYPLKDGLYASLGTAFHVSTSTSLGAAFNWREKLVTGGDDAQDVTAFVSHNPSDRWNLVAYVLKGFTNGSPDIGVGGQATYRF